MSEPKWYDDRNARLLFWAGTLAAVVGAAWLISPPKRPPTCREWCQAHHAELLSFGPEFRCMCKPVEPIASDSGG
jgi:hypothetical protein